MDQKKQTFGLLASGSCGPWEIVIDESIERGDRWCAQIDGPTVSFYFEIASLDIVDRMARFLEQRSEATKRQSVGSAQPCGRLVIGKDKKTPVALVKDDEYADRYFLLVGTGDRPIVRFLIAGTDAEQISSALLQVREDLDSQADATQRKAVS